METQDAMLRILDDAALARVATRLASMQRNSIRITATLTDEDALPLGASKLGGSPDLPHGWRWPTATLSRPASMAPGVAASWSGAVLPPDDTIALPFIAQIRLADVQAYDTEHLLPADGMLYFFYNPVYYAGLPYGKPEHWQVLYDPGGSHFQRTAPPRAIPAEATYGACAVTFTQETMLPQIETCFIGETADSTASVILNPEEWAIYTELRYELRANRRIHHLIGYSDDVQPAAMEGKYKQVRTVFWPELPPFEQFTPQAQQAELEQGRLLLQVDEQNNGMRFGRDGRLFFFIREQDLRARDFSRVWATEQ